MQIRIDMAIILIVLALILLIAVIDYTQQPEEPEGFPSEGKQSIDPKLTTPKLSDFLPNYSENFTHYEPYSMK